MRFVSKGPANAREFAVSARRVTWTGEVKTEIALPCATGSLRSNRRSGWPAKPHFPAKISMTRHGTAGFCRVWRSHLLPCVSGPAAAREERRDLRGGAIGILAMREVSHPRKQREIEVGEGLVKPVGPGKRKQRVMLGPADAGRGIDRSELWRLAFHHSDAPLMGGTVMRKTAGEIAGFQEIIGEGFDDVVERILAVRPGLEKVANIRPAAFARSADQAWGHLQLIEGLVPDVIEPFGFRHLRPDAGVDEVKEK